MMSIVTGDSFIAAVREWNEQNLDFKIWPQEATDISLDKENRSTNLYRIVKRTRNPLVYHYVISDYDVKTGRVKLLSIDVRKLAKLVNGRALKEEKFKKMKCPLSSTARMIKKYAQKLEGGDLLVRLYEEIGK